MRIIIAWELKYSGDPKENLGNLEQITLKDNQIPEGVMNEIKNPDNAQDYVSYCRYKDYRKLDYWK